MKQIGVIVSIGVLTRLFFCSHRYFRVLKRAPTSPLMPSVLEGLSKFSHLINLDFMNDLITVLKTLVGRPKQPLADVLHCAIAGFKIMQNSGDTLNVDLKEFYVALYTHIMKLPANSIQSEHNIILALHCLELMLGRRNNSIDRVAGFIKRLCLVAQQLSAHSLLAFLTVVTQLVRRYPKVEQLLDSEFVALGVYLPELNDDEYCNPFATSLWELADMQRHYHPMVNKFANDLGKMGDSNASANDVTNLSMWKTARKMPTRVYKEYDSSEGGFNPSIPTPKKHPFIDGKKSTKKKDLSAVIREKGLVACKPHHIRTERMPSSSETVRTTLLEGNPQDQMDIDMQAIDRQLKVHFQTEKKFQLQLQKSQLETLAMMQKKFAALQRRKKEKK
eukprot:TRINITY_DN533_c3_g1_i1.p1 TRINITY_DN533_c3_g1~~TRINITY_DN533_c3_g1_i1.p1  ORF type:complete len:390 (+),score=151.54 TRINITY_DN533_c3_g1_i1:300-1469(+)